MTGRIPCPGAGPAPGGVEFKWDWWDWEAAAWRRGTREPATRAREAVHLDLGQNATARCSRPRVRPSLASVDLAGSPTVGSRRSPTPHARGVEFGRAIVLRVLARLRTHLSLNRIGGAIPPSWMTDMHALYTVDLSHNELAGELPATGPSMTRLRRVFLDHNKLRGSFGAQLTRMYDALKSETHERDSFAAGTMYALSGNSFSGALPEALRSLFTHPKTARALAQCESFRCDKDTGGWPQWAARPARARALVRSRGAVGGGRRTKKRKLEEGDDETRVPTDRRRSHRGSAGPRREVRCRMGGSRFTAGARRRDGARRRGHSRRVELDESGPWTVTDRHKQEEAAAAAFSARPIHVPRSSRGDVRRRRRRTPSEPSPVASAPESRARIQLPRRTSVTTRASTDDSAVRATRAWPVTRADPRRAIGGGELGRRVAAAAT